ncbi:hypothetical protein M422DRAFT_70481 [Sphaerobolus stellatus SS14]|uniref:F-box domain-containing protein n=1 Tax=Sphaerobolus stellatus (strain SS14) TaxID=990650 RepID=A0A0C9UUW1_SPHS4|nr:hypothetical protein M422DRAFT_70481 [Sphaerobolus stellatus SS14]
MDNSIYRCPLLQYSSTVLPTSSLLPTVTAQDSPFGDASDLDLLSSLAYRRSDLDDGVINAILYFPSHYPVHYYPSMGLFDWLPRFILEDILLDVDLLTLVRCRELNSRAEALIDDITTYRRLRQSAGNAVAALLCSGAASFFSTRYVYSLMVLTSTCNTCGQFGGFLFIPQGVRCCMYCLLTRPEFLPMSKHTAKRVFWLSEAAFRDGSIPVMEGLSGLYGLHERRAVSRKRLFVSVVLVKEKAAKNLTPRMVQQMENVEGIDDEHTANAGMAYEFEDPRSVVHATHLTRLQCAVPFPFVDIFAAGPIIQTGISCRGCKQVATWVPYMFSAEKKRRAIEMELRMYTEDDFLEHIKGCEAAQQLWKKVICEAVNGEKVDPSISPSST